MSTSKSISLAPNVESKTFTSFYVTQDSELSNNCGYIGQWWTILRNEFDFVRKDFGTILFYLFIHLFIYIFLQQIK